METTVLFKISHVKTPVENSFQNLELGNDFLSLRLSYVRKVTSLTTLSILL